MTIPLLKEALLSKCTEWISLRKEHVLQNISNIETALFEESKGTSGDKHHTTRAMLQIDRENAGKQLQEIEKVEVLLRKTPSTEHSENVRLGSLVETSNGDYFISISAGIVRLNNHTYYCVSSNAPIGQLLLGKRMEEAVHFNSKEIRILNIH